ncbi:MAG: type II toxin-antitoxin system VapC family toxin [Actinomycetota bacterium]
MTSLVAVDTSVAVPLLLASHRSHAVVVEWWSGRDVALSGHALAETYSVLTRLPGDARLDPPDAALLISDRFSAPLVLGPELSLNLPRELARLGIAGGAVYDALVALAAKEHSVPLATRDQRAKSTYDLVGVTVEIVA